MTRICWWLAEKLSRLLEPDERDAVLGDFAESGIAGGNALIEVLGLVARRQAALWNDWRPWVALAGVVAPLGMLLSLVSRHLAETSAIYAWLYVNNWDVAHLENAGLRLDLARYIATFLLQYLTLVCWSWTSGFALASLSRLTVRVTGTLFCLVLLGELLAVPQHHNEVNAAVFQLTFYDVVLPLILRTVLVLLPSILGMRHGLRLARPPLLKTVLWAVVVVIMTAMASRTLAMSGVYGWWRLGADSWQLWLLPLAVLWPVGYMIATASWQRWSGKELERA